MPNDRSLWSSDFISYRYDPFFYDWPYPEEDFYDACDMYDELDYPDDWDDISFEDMEDEREAALEAQVPMFSREKWRAQDVSYRDRGRQHERQCKRAMASIQGRNVNDQKQQTLRTHRSGNQLVHPERCGRWARQRSVGGACAAVMRKLDRRVKCKQGILLPMLRHDLVPKRSMLQLYREEMYDTVSDPEEVIASYNRSEVPLQRVSKLRPPVWEDDDYLDYSDQW